MCQFIMSLLLGSDEGLFSLWISNVKGEIERKSKNFANFDLSKALEIRGYETWQLLYMILMTSCYVIK